MSDTAVLNLADLSRYWGDQRNLPIIREMIGGCYTLLVRGAVKDGGAMANDAGPVVTFSPRDVDVRLIAEDDFRELVRLWGVFGAAAPVDYPEETTLEDATYHLVRESFRLLLRQLVFAVLVTVTVDERTRLPRPDAPEARLRAPFSERASNHLLYMEQLFLFMGAFILFGHTVDEVQEIHRLRETLDRTLDIYWNTVDSCYASPLVLACRKAMGALMRKFASHDFKAEFALYREKRMLLDSAIERGELKLRWEAPTTDERLDRIEGKVDRLTRGLREYLARFSKAIAGFIALFAPGRRKPSEIEAQAALAPAADRYKCLARTKNVLHVTQLKAVIDQTYDQPIEPGKNRPDGEYTLAQAVRDVWQKHGEAWEKSSAAFTRDQLKAAAYHLTGAPDDPYCYRQ